MIDCEECNRLGELGIWEDCPACTSEAIRAEMALSHKRMEKIALLVWAFFGLLFVAWAICLVFFPSLIN